MSAIDRVAARATAALNAGDPGYAWNISPAELRAIRRRARKALAENPDLTMYASHGVHLSPVCAEDSHPDHTLDWWEVYVYVGSLKP